MHVVATAGHVDHGKSTLVRALTGQEPDRLEEERRRGLSIELGYTWTDLDGAGPVAFVDVPGHERFVSTMLAGVGPVPAALLVVAADDPWMPQTAEHLAALDALGVQHGVVAVSRCDLADPAATTARAEAELSRTSLAGAPIVAVSAVTGAGLDELRARLVTLVQSLPAPAPTADVRLWVDRCFTMKGAGTVVTGTLPAGTIRVGDSLAAHPARVRVRAMQSLGRDVDVVSGVARVALNVTGDGAATLARGDVLLTPAAWHLTEVVDVRVTSDRLAPSTSAGQHRRGADLAPERPLLHIGAASLTVHHRPLGDGLARLRLDQPLPLRVGDRALLRDPGSRRLWGITVLDPMPPALGRRGAAAARAEILQQVDRPDLAGEVTRRGLIAAADLRRIGVPVDESAAPIALASVDGWLISDERAAAAAATATELVREHEHSRPLEGGLALTALAEKLSLSPELVRMLIRPPLHVESGRVTSRRTTSLPPPVARAIETLLEELRDDPFAAPTADRLRQLGLNDKAAAVAARAGLLLRPAPGIVLAAGSDALAVRWLAELPQPFTLSEARQRLGTSRRVVLPLLAHLDRMGLIRRLPNDRREIV